MARRAPFPLSRLPAFLEHSMMLLAAAAAAEPALVAEPRVELDDPVVEAWSELTGDSVVATLVTAVPRPDSLALLAAI